MRYKILLEYNGANFIGWQKQLDNPNSIQEQIEKAIFNLTGENSEVYASGRTDAGVHALGQVAHFDLVKEKSDPENFAYKMRAGLNHYLHNIGIAILNCVPVDDNFHSRFDAKMRHYQYRIINRHPPLTLEKDFAWQVVQPLEIKDMITATRHLIGKHDFSSFRDSECQADSPIRTIEKIGILREDNLIKLNFSAKSFLHHQVRNMVGTLVNVGLGKIKPEDVIEILKACDRTKSGPNAPACGLYFLKVDY